MYQSPLRFLLFVAAVLVMPSTTWAELKRIEQSAASGLSAAVVVPGDLPLLYTTQLLPIDKANQQVAPETPWLRARSSSSNSRPC